MKISMRRAKKQFKAVYKARAVLNQVDREILELLEKCWKKEQAQQIVDIMDRLSKAIEILPTAADILFLHKKSGDIPIFPELDF